MAYRNKTYVAFDGDRDMHYYNLMRAWRDNKGFSFNFFDAHDLNSARDSSLEYSIKNQLSERMRNTKVFVLLIGESTQYLYRFVRWEIEQALKRNLPIIAVNLNNKNGIDRNRCPAILRDELALHIPFKQRAIEVALDDWPKQHDHYTRRGQAGPHYYNTLAV
ncbi:MTH538 TIR-like domain [Pseudovibrio ascidiaceicola]|uniref:MTH538 TIR-like domain n=1 Tax=Pseudovibrio ascidiaceicola TaxID=285279 RepID=A0A1I3Z1L8_9HYPH|nr:TIR domain-containing protein [Pseudovibrio ascidiaceicola]SFK37386.1 MTH538 TIR-like domain [Pseudovibrio ascidiaceicola]